MRRVNVSHFKPCPLPGKATRAQCAQPSFMSYFREGISLVHELGELARGEELFQNGCHGFRDEHFVGHKVLYGLVPHFFLYETGKPFEAVIETVLYEFPDSSDSPVSEVVYIVCGSPATF